MAFLNAQFQWPRQVFSIRRVSGSANSFLDAMFDEFGLAYPSTPYIGKSGNLFHWPYWIGLTGGLCFELLAKILHKKLPISSIRMKKFCANTMFESIVIKTTGFMAPVSLTQGLERTIIYEFINHIADQVFYAE
jgi:hypothetical protein